MDKLQAMSVFVRIAETGSLTAAAESLGKSLPAVVRMLATLEDNLQIRLLNRTTRRIALTDEGRLYLERCYKILADIEETERLLSSNQVEPVGKMTVTAPVRFGEMHVSPAVNRFLKLHPRVQINLILLDRVVNLLEEGIDLAVRIAPLVDSTLIAKPVTEIRRVVCASPDVLEKLGKPDHPEALAQMPCIQFTGVPTGSVWQFRDGSKKLSVKIGGNLMCNHIAASVEACVSGLGFGCFYSYQVKPYVDQGKLKIILEDYEPPPIPISLIYQHRQLISSKLRVFADWLTQELKDSLAYTKQSG